MSNIVSLDDARANRERARRAFAIRIFGGDSAQFAFAYVRFDRDQISRLFEIAEEMGEMEDDVRNVTCVVWNAVALAQLSDSDERTLDIGAQLCSIPWTEVSPSYGAVVEVKPIIALMHVTQRDVWFSIDHRNDLVVTTAMMPVSAFAERTEQ